MGCTTHYSLSWWGIEWDVHWGLSDLDLDPWPAESRVPEVQFVSDQHRLRVPTGQALLAMPSVPLVVCLF